MSDLSKKERLSLRQRLESRERNPFERIDRELEVRFMRNSAVDQGLSPGQTKVTAQFPTESEIDDESERSQGSVLPDVSNESDASSDQPDKVRIDDDDMSKPVLFYGKDRELSQLITYTEIKFLTDDAFEDDERKKSAYFASLFRGPALDWLAKERDSDPTIFNDYEKLRERTKIAFGKTKQTQIQDASRRITFLHQKTSVQNYYTRFARDAQVLDWNDSAKQAQFLRGLKLHIREAIITKNSSYETLEDLAEEAQRIDEQLYSTKRYGRENRQQGGSGFKGKCNKCGRFGHKAANCRQGHKRESEW